MTVIECANRHERASLGKQEDGDRAGADITVGLILGESTYNRVDTGAD